MPSSEQEMRERAREKANEMLLGKFGAQMIIFDKYYPKSCDMYKRREAIADDLCNFATLERAEARRETLLEAIQIAESNFMAVVVVDALRAKLTPAPEAEKEIER